jgi:hypothetical protein
MMYREDRGWGIDTTGSPDEAIAARLSAIETRLTELESGKGE